MEIRVSDHLVPQRRTVLVDKRGAYAAVSHPVHEFAQASASFADHRAPGIAQVVEVNAWQTCRSCRLPLGPGEVAPRKGAPFGPVKTMLSSPGAVRWSR